MNDLPPLPKGYMLAPCGSSYDETGEQGEHPILYTCSGWTEWHWWGNIRPGHWKLGGLSRVFAIPSTAKPRYTCPLEVSSDS